MRRIATTGGRSFCSATTLQACCTAVLLWLSMSATALRGGEDMAHLCGACGYWSGQGVQRAAASAMLPSLVPKEHFVNAVTWGATV